MSAHIRYTYDDDGGVINAPEGIGRGGDRITSGLLCWGWSECLMFYHPRFRCLSASNVRRSSVRLCIYGVGRVDEFAEICFFDQNCFSLAIYSNYFGVN